MVPIFGLLVGGFLRVLRFFPPLLDKGPFACIINVLLYSKRRVMICTSSSARWQQASKRQPCGALNIFGKVEINAPINIVIIIVIIIIIIIINDYCLHHLLTRVKFLLVVRHQTLLNTSIF